MDLELRPCGPEQLNSLLNIQEEAFFALPDAGLLRRNSREMFAACLRPPHVTLGAWRGKELAAFSTLFFPGDNSENLSHALSGLDLTGIKTANYKLCIVRPPFRGLGLQYQLGMALEPFAQAAGAELLCATVAPQNRHSVENIRRMGYTYNRTLEKYGLERELYFKLLPAAPSVLRPEQGAQKNKGGQ